RSEPRRMRENSDLALIAKFLALQPERTPFDANPLARALGTDLTEIDLEQGRLRLEFEPRADFMQGAGVIQGGALAAMLDFAMTFVVMARLVASPGNQQTAATTSMNVMYLKPAPRGRYCAIGEIERVGRSIAFARAQLSPVSGGTAVASATATMA